MKIKTNIRAGLGVRGIPGRPTLAAAV